MGGAYSKHGANAKNAYVMLESSDDVRNVRLVAQGLVADKQHVLRVDAVGEAAQLVQFDRKRSVFVGNLPSNTSEADLRKTFADIGTVDAVRIVRDRHTAECKGFAFVRFKERAAVKAALNLWGTEVRGRAVRVMKIERPEGDDQQKLDETSHPATLRIQQRREKRIRQRMRKSSGSAQ